MAHTQGPWALDGDINAMNLDVVSGEGRIAMIDCENDDLTDAEVMANARLMLAAPEMLAALEEALEVLGELEPEERWPGLDNVERNWRFVIAKAKGEA